MAIDKVLEYLNEGYEWVIDFDIEKFFDTVNHDKLISTLRERVKDDKTLHLIREYLKAGVMENGLVSATTDGVPQGGPLSPVLSNIYLDKLDKELEARGLHFVRYEATHTPNQIGIVETAKPSAPRLLHDIPRLIGMNGDCIGWLSIEGTAVDYPVMHTPAYPQKYLRMNFFGESSSAGVPFMDHRCGLRDDNIIIYGHNMRKGTMFGRSRII